MFVRSKHVTVKTEYESTNVLLYNGKHLVPNNAYVMNIYAINKKSLEVPNHVVDTEKKNMFGMYLISVFVM